MPETQDYYQLLGVNRSASEEEIRRAYRKLARELHPDINKAPDAAERFARVTEAYDVLSDKEKRQQYDLHGVRSPWTGAAGNPRARTAGRGGVTDPDLGSIFEELFGRAGPGGDPFTAGRTRPGAHARPAPQRGADREVDLAISFMTAARGGTERLRLRQEDGRERTIEVRIPAGVSAGARLRVPGEGLPGRNGGPAGDLMARVEIGQHPLFRREGLDLVTDVTVTFPEAVLGAEVNVPLLDGSATLRIPPGTASGRRLRLRERGITASDGRKGDLLAAIRIDVPVDPDPETRALIEQLAARLPAARRTVGDT